VLIIIMRCFSRKSHWYMHSFRSTLQGVTSYAGNRSLFVGIAAVLEVQLTCRRKRISNFGTVQRQLQSFDH
jgi:hypothetical protein